jgi:hypothetical protein
MTGVTAIDIDFLDTLQATPAAVGAMPNINKSFCIRNV